ncbi:MAG: hypothetical protein AAF675_16775, partial [Pseudomonadota bacterium]
MKPTTRAEAQILADLPNGRFIVLGDLPDPNAGPERQTRASFIRALALGLDGAQPLPPQGLQIAGALIQSDGIADPYGGTPGLDLEGATLPTDLALMHCRFQHPPRLRNTRLQSLFLNGSDLPGLEADGLEARGNVFLRSATATGEIRLPGAKLGGDLSCVDARFTNTDGRALTADGLEARGYVFLRRVKATGEIRLLRVKLGSGLDCDDARFSNTDGPALFADGLEARGDVFLRRATATGEIRLPGVKLGGNLSCDDARFSNTDGPALSADRLEARGGVFLRRVATMGEIRLLGAKLGGNLSCVGARFSASKGKALDASGAVVEGAFFLRDEVEVSGPFNLTASSFGAIDDDPACWPEAGNLALDRCVYGAFTGQGVSGAERIDWLSRQDPARWNSDFWPQPYEQCARVLREMGHRLDARMVLIEKERLQRRYGRAVLATKLDAARHARAIDRSVAEKLQSVIETADERLSVIRSGNRRLGTYFLEGVKRARRVRWKKPGSEAGAQRLEIDAERRAALRNPVLPVTEAIVRLWCLLLYRRLWDRVLGAVVGYGHRPQLALVWAFGFWALGAGVFASLEGRDAMMPNNPFILRSAEWVRCSAPLDAPLALAAVDRKGAAVKTTGLRGDERVLDCFARQAEGASYPG